MATHDYQVQRTGVEVVDRNFDLILQALTALARAIVNPSFVSFVVSGNNGGGYVPLIPSKLPDGITPVARALTGMEVVCAVDLTTSSLLADSFERVLSGNDQVKQLTASNLSAHKLLIMVAGALTWGCNRKLSTFR